MSRRSEKKENRRGHRQGRGDRDDPGPGGSATSFAGLTDISSYLTSSGSYTLRYTDLAQRIYGTLPEITEGKSEPVGLPQREGDLPIMGWKAAQIVNTRVGLRFAGILYSSSHYGTVETAQCYRADDRFGFYMAAALLSGVPTATNRHPAPDEHCRCGFYGVNVRPDVLEQRHHVMLEAEFFGKVVVAEKGYRAEKQRVVGMHLPERCTFCAQTPTQFVLPNGYGTPENGALHPRCAAHVGPFDVQYELAQIEAELGVRFW